MPFHALGNLVFQQFLRPLAEEAGYRVERADTTLNQRAIMQDVIRGIQDADLIIADLTGRNANVFYELGLAHAANHERPVLLIAQSTSDIPFDLAAYRAVVYSIELDPNGPARSSLSTELLALLSATRAGEVAYSNPFTDFAEVRPPADDAAPPVEGIIDIQRRFIREDMPRATAAVESIGGIAERSSRAQTPIIAQMTNPPDGVDELDHRITKGAELAAAWESMAAELTPIVDDELVPAVLATERDFAAWIRTFQLAPGNDPTEFLASASTMAGGTAELAATMTNTAVTIRTASQWLTALIGPGERLAALFDRIAATVSRLVALPEQLRRALGLSDDDPATA